VFLRETEIIPSEPDTDHTGEGKSNLIFGASVRSESPLPVLFSDFKHANMRKQFWKNILSVREKSPLVQNVTNRIVINNIAGDTLVINIGILDQ